MLKSKIILITIILLTLVVEKISAASVTLEDDSKMVVTYISNQSVDNSATNYESLAYARLGQRYGSAHMMIDYDTTFSESIDSILIYFVIGSLGFYSNSADTVRPMTAWGARTFSPSSVTWNTYDGSNSWTTAGGTGSSDTSGYSYEASSNIPGSSIVIGDTVIIRLASVCSSFPPWGSANYALVYPKNGNCCGHGYLGFNSEEYSSDSSLRPWIEVFYSTGGGGDPLPNRRRRIIGGFE